MTWDFTALLAAPSTVAMVTDDVNLTSSGLDWPSSPACRRRVAACLCRALGLPGSLTIAGCCRTKIARYKLNVKLSLHGRTLFVRPVNM